jgi:hypothetical protein
VNCNGSQTFTISANTNYKIDSVFVDDAYIGKDSLYSFSDVTENHTIRATFKEKNNLPIVNAGSDSVEKNRTKAITLTGNDVDANDTTLTFILDALPTHGDFQGNIISINGTTAQVVYRPDYSYVGADSFSFYVRDAQGARSLSTWFSLTVYAKIDSNKFRSFSQSDLTTASVKRPKKGIRPMPTTGNVLDTLFVNGSFKKLKDKTNPAYPGGMVLGVAQLVKDSAKKYGWIRLIGKGNDVQKSLTQSGSPSGFDELKGKTFVKELKNPKTQIYSNQLAGELLALKTNIAASEQKITNEGFGNLIYDNPLQPDTFVTQRFIIQGKTLTQIATNIDTMLTYYKRYYTTTPSEEYSKLATALVQINEAFRSSLDTVSWSPLQLTNGVRIDAVEFLRKGNSKEMLFMESEFQSVLPENMMLLQNYPNPFNPTTAISFQLSAISEVTLKVYNVLGQEVAVLIDNERMESGEYEVQFDASGLTSGVYFYRLNVNNGEFVQTKKLLLMK